MPTWVVTDDPTGGVPTGLNSRDASESEQAGDCIEGVALVVSLAPDPVVVGAASGGWYGIDEPTF